MKKLAIGIAALAYAVSWTAGPASAHSSHDAHNHDDHSGHHSGHGPFGWLGHHGDEHHGSHHGGHGHEGVDHSDDYYGRITHVDGNTVYARSFWGLGPEWSFEVDDATVIERWDGSEKWELNDLHRGNYIHVMYKVGEGKHWAKVIHVSWTAHKADDSHGHHGHH